LDSAREVVVNEVKTFINDINSILPKSESKKPSKKHSSRGSRNMSRVSGASIHLTSVYLKQTAKLEEAKLRYKYAEQEAELMSKEAELKTS
jgi:hypothetical protein